LVPTTPGAQRPTVGESIDQEVGMRYRTLVAGIGAAALALAAAGCGGGGDTALAKRTLTFTEKQSDSSFSFVDNAPKSSTEGEEPKLSNGDQLSFTADMLDTSRKDVGDLDVSCTVTATTTGSFDDSHAQCVGTADIPGGSLTLTVGGKAFGAGTTRGAVVGGTGDYAGASGSFTSSDETGADRPSVDRFVIFVPEQ
jgi:hypothetical protein